jgi:hypothetical protein
MLFKIKLKNSDATVLVDAQVYEHLDNNPYFKRLDLLNNLRLHSAGYAVYQKSWRRSDGSYKVETIYLHKYIAEHFLEKISPEDSQSVRIRNDNKLDCRVENLEWASVSKIARKCKAYGASGYRGVYRYGKNWKAMIYHDRKPLNLGVFATPEEAAACYNERAAEYFGEEATLNVIGKPVTSEMRTKKPKKATYNDNVRRRSPRRKMNSTEPEGTIIIKRK